MQKPLESTAGKHNTLQILKANQSVIEDFFIVQWKEKNSYFNAEECSIYGYEKQKYA